MKYKMILVSLIASLSTAPAFAEHRPGKSSFSDYARVTHVEPIYRTVQVSRPHEECREEEVYYPSGSRHGGGNTALSMIVGGALGGVLGHNISRHHRDTGKIAGAVIGSAIGHEVAENKRGRQSYRHAYEERCRTVNEHYSEEKLEGYYVTYRYHGETLTTRMNRDPGDRLKVRVSVRPVGH